MIRLSAESLFASFRWLLTIRLETFIAAAIIAYFSGWHYVNIYFDTFDVNRSSFSFDYYTVFLYSFFVLVELPAIVVSLTPGALVGIGTFLGMLLISAIDITLIVHNSVLILRRILVAGLGIASIFYFSTEAGRNDANQVIYGKQARAISIVLTQEVKEAIANQFDRSRAETQIQEIIDAGSCGGLALIWRNSHETLVMLYETTVGEGHGTPLVTYRIPNEFIALVESKIDKGNGPGGCESHQESTDTTGE